MATCKECLHFEACVDMLQAMGFTVDGDGYLAERRCHIFKDKSGYSEVVHGRWIPINTPHKWRFQCDQCKHYVDAGTDRNYCPNCGADMRERKTDD